MCSLESLSSGSRAAPVKRVQRAALRLLAWAWRVRDTLDRYADVWPPTLPFSRVGADVKGRLPFSRVGADVKGRLPFERVGADVKGRLPFEGSVQTWRRPRRTRGLPHEVGPS
jgi:hypothetical protein